MVLKWNLQSEKIKKILNKKKTNNNNVLGYK